MGVSIGDLLIAASLEGGIQLTSSPCWGFRYLKQRARDGWLRMLSVALEEGELKVLTLTAELLLFCLASLFSFVSAFSRFSDQIYSLDLGGKA